MSTTAFHAAAALFALLILARNARRALRLLARGEAGPERLAALVPALACLAAGAVLVVAVKGLAAALMLSRGGTP